MCIRDRPVTLYNPAGRKRRRLLAEALEICREARGGDILCAFVRHAGRPEETRWIGRLADPVSYTHLETVRLCVRARQRSGGRGMVFCTGGRTQAGARRRLPDMYKRQSVPCSRKASGRRRWKKGGRRKNAFDGR